MNVDFFKPTEEELNNPDGKPLFKDKEEVTFLVTEIKEKEMEGGSKMIILNTKVVTGECASMEYPFFYKSDERGRKNWIKLLKALFTLDYLKSGQLQSKELVSKQFKSVCSSKPKADGNGVWQNFNDFTEVSGVPTIGGETPKLTEDDIPF